MTRITEHIEQFLFWALTGTVAALASGFWWLIRTIFTNREEIRLLREELIHRDRQRQEDRERMAKIEDGVDTIKTVMMEMGKSKP